jgi:hypothetical protein
MQSQAQMNGTPVMANIAHPATKRIGADNAEQLNTYIYDYFLRNGHLGLARAMLEADLKVVLEQRSPNNKTNGIESLESKEDFPPAQIPRSHPCDNSFLLDWWSQFWDMWTANRGNSNKHTAQYIQHTRVSDTPVLWRVGTD